jgi:hypothetical protein
MFFCSESIVVVAIIAAVALFLVLQGKQTTLLWIYIWFNWNEIIVYVEFRVYWINDKLVMNTITYGWFDIVEHENKLN